MKKDAFKRYKQEVIWNKIGILIYQLYVNHLLFNRRKQFALNKYKDLTQEG